MGSTLGERTLSWLVSLLLHAAIFLAALGSAQSIQAPKEAPLRPVEIALITEAEFQQAASKPRRRRGRRVKSRRRGFRRPKANLKPPPAAPAPKPVNPWKSFQKGSKTWEVSKRRPESEKLELSAAEAGVRETEVAQGWMKSTIRPKAMTLAKRFEIDEPELAVPQEDDSAQLQAAFMAKPGKFGNQDDNRAAAVRDSVGETRMQSSQSSSPAFSESFHVGGGGAPGGGDLRQGSGSGVYFEMKGPLSSRRLLSSVLPNYPDWASEQGLEVAVTVRFVVNPSGSIKTPIIVYRTSGYPRIDRIVIETVQDWRFARLRHMRREEQWGILTFRFRLSG